MMNGKRPHYNSLVKGLLHKSYFSLEKKLMHATFTFTFTFKYTHCDLFLFYQAALFQILLKAKHKKHLRKI